MEEELQAFLSLVQRGGECCHQDSNSVLASLNKVTANTAGLGTLVVLLPQVRELRTALAVYALTTRCQYFSHVSDSSR